MRLVLDTNVWLSGLFWEGEISRIIGLAEEGRFQIVISKEIILEVVDVLKKEAKFQRFMGERSRKIEDLVRTILSIGDLIHVKNKLNTIKEHPADNIILETALDGKVQYIVSYDNHLLKLKKFKGIELIKPRELSRTTNQTLRNQQN